MYLSKNESDLPHGYYIWAVAYEEQLVSLIPLMGLLGYLQIVGTLQFGLIGSNLPFKPGGLGSQDCV